ncbi:hypothetical protein [Haloferula sp.]|uniref:hypothetical protein n=1 Tax=Haloferula sp. TaxID=2497595 RepID=UPI003C76704A
MKKILTAVAVVALLGLFFSWWFHPTNVLKRRAASFFETAEVPVTMSELARSSRGPNIAEYLADHVEVIAPKNLEEDLRSGYSRDDAAAFYSGVARYCRQVSFLKPEAISVVHLGESNAKVALRIDTIVELPDRRPIDGILKIETTWEKVDGRWLMDGISWEETPR